MEFLRQRIEFAKERVEFAKERVEFAKERVELRRVSTNTSHVTIEPPADKISAISENKFTNMAIEQRKRERERRRQDYSPSDNSPINIDFS